MHGKASVAIIRNRVIWNPTTENVLRQRNGV